MFNVSEYLDSDYRNDCVKEKILIFGSDNKA